MDMLCCLYDIPFLCHLESASGAEVTSRAAKWAKGSLTQILRLIDDWPGSTLDICHSHLSFAAPFPCNEPAGELGRRVFLFIYLLFVKGYTTKVLMFGVFFFVFVFYRESPSQPTKHVAAGRAMCTFLFLVPYMWKHSLSNDTFF